ncbi:hypothetical protein ACOSZF_20850 [Cytobacillus firmus]|uniref:hypothetical protein n=1 Tax=Cytobacillus firmus TaxID=1399 RepID=UPI003B9EB2D5
MAFNLQAALRLDGSQFSNALRRITRETERANRATGVWRDSQGRLRDEMGRFARQSDRSATSIGRLGRALSAPLRGIGSLTSGLYGLVGAYAAAEGAKKVFEQTIGEAAKYEQSSVMISAILNDKKLGQDYMRLVDQFSIDSPIMDSQSMLANSKSFLTQSKDMKQLEKMWSLAERMAAIDPYQGVEGAVFALRELFSGDAISMVRRFEMPRQVMNEIKKMDLADQLVALDNYFNKIGMTQKLIDEMGGTTLGVWAQIKESANVILRTMGAPALEQVKTFLKGIREGMTSVKEVVADRNLFTPEEFREKYNRAIKVEQFKETGARIIENITTGFINGVSAVGRWVEAIKSSDDWKQANSLHAKIGIVFSSLWDAFKSWLDGGGRTQLASAASELIKILAEGVRVSSGPMMEVGTQIGGAIGAGVISGAASYIKDNWWRIIPEGVQNGPVGTLVQLPGKLARSAMDKLTHGQFSKAIEKGRKGKSHASGLTRVPYNGYQATLHKGERVLTPEEAKVYNSGDAGVTISGNTIHIHGVNGNLEKAADQILEILANKIEAEGVAGA